MDWILSQARYFNNIPILDPKYRSVVHLEDEEDKVFWDKVLQRVRPGAYFYVPYSKSERGNDTRGCDQCLKFMPFLTDRFFVCIDSDLRFLLGEANLDCSHYVMQTYTYSWESHFCYSLSLQASVTENAGGCGFDFSIFLKGLSQVLYEPLLLLLYCKRIGSSYLTEATFRQIFRTQCTSAEAQNNGRGYVEYISDQFRPILAGSSTIGFDADTEGDIYKAKGLEAGNAYLHVRGHNIYDLVVYIGKMFVRPLQISFERDVVLNETFCGDYWEFREIERDINSMGRDNG